MNHKHAFLACLLAALLAVGPTTLAVAAEPGTDWDIQVSDRADFSRSAGIAILDWPEEGSARAITTDPVTGETLEIALPRDLFESAAIEGSWQGADGTVHGTLVLPAGLAATTSYDIAFQRDAGMLTGTISRGPGAQLHFRIPVDRLPPARVECSGICGFVGLVARAASLLIASCASRQAKLDRECCEDARIFGCGGHPARGCGASGYCGMGECRKDYDCGSQQNDKNKGENDSWL